MSGLIQQQADISQLKDIVEPQGASFLPLATPVWVILIVLLVVICVTTIYIWRARQQRKPLRYAQQTLRQLEHPTVKDITFIAKRVALVYFPRRKIAQLSGRAWLEFLGATEQQHSELLRNADRVLFQPGHSEWVDQYQQLVDDWLSQSPRRLTRHV
ncbi:hypothetical protein BFR57_04275 [Idiomarina sp. MD25a]|uniref:DUF4381 domain-containing protein n=1 Tax=Idiomarina sp. MD25a TaxID=1889913 RepID=UPI0008F8CDB4|nr:DUF4381 domain-containing protein [Idiomarina sp. MD25a]OIM99782.1 hypothetical protein BFR57_04275 [Idiomarina sp. MD25a]